MNRFSPSVETVEQYIEDLKRAMDVGAANVPALEELDRPSYRSAVEKVEYWAYIKSGDYHYFVARVLFLHHIAEYSLFSGHQCIENYFKAYLKSEKQVPPNSHNIEALLDRYRSIAPHSDEFLHHDTAQIIVAKYAPFYELARYPVQRTRPKGGCATLFPVDIYVLDYFVLRMRSMLEVPSNTWDILKKGHYSLFDCKQHFPAFYSVFFANNINFLASPYEP